MFSIFNKRVHINNLSLMFCLINERPLFHVLFSGEFLFSLSADPDYSWSYTCKYTRIFSIYFEPLKYFRRPVDIFYIVKKKKMNGCTQIRYWPDNRKMFNICLSTLWVNSKVVRRHVFYEIIIYVENVKIKEQQSIFFYTLFHTRVLDWSFLITSIRNIVLWTLDHLEIFINIFR